MKAFPHYSSFQIVFHLVVDKTFEADEITSRNAIMLGVRKIFQAASRYSIRNITFPLLLVENTTEVSLPHFDESHKF